MKSDNSLSIYKRLLEYVIPYWKMGVVMIIATAIYSATNAIYIKQLEGVIDEGFIKNNMQAIYSTIMVLLVVTVARGFGFFISRYASRRVSSDIVLDIRKQMFAHLQRLPASYFDKTTSGKTLSRFNYDVLQVTDAATEAVIIIIREGVLVIALLSYLLYQNWQLTLMIFTLAPVIGIIVTVISKRLRKLAKRTQGNMGMMNHTLDENIKGQKIVKVYGGQKHEMKKFDHEVNQIRNAAIKSEVALSISTPVIEILLVCVTSVIIVVLAKEAKAGLLTPGQFFSYIAMIGFLPSPIKKLMKINEFVQRGLAASQGIFSYLDEISEPSSALKSEDKTVKSEGELSFDNVYFSYHEDWVLKDFNLHIRSGETVALVGASGSGKSSLASLIPRFYEVRKGTIKLDGTDISGMDLGLLREQIAFVNQDIVLFDDSVTRNIAYGVPSDDIDINRVKESAQLAQAESFILNMSDGYDSFIGESGLRLSGGQKQRLAIARAIYKDAPIIILDEATSALDTESEKKVQIALEKLMQDRTSIVIAHRLSTVHNADRILVLDNGAIIESGTHYELMSRKGRYYQLNQSLDAFH